ncbi:MAG: phytoene desaturase [Spirochaetales bacterium]|nr:phytoene desaturase [Spirochaetales bacterium]
MGEKKILVIGAGLAGLSSACLLAKSGYTVTVMDNHTTPGGVARRFTEKGFTFDMGPSWYLMPEVYDDFFAQFGKATGSYYELADLTPSYRIYFEGQGTATLCRDQKKNRALFDLFEKDGGKKLSRYLDNARMKYEIVLKHFLYKDFTSILDMANPRLFTDGIKLNIAGKLDSFVDRFFDDHRSKKIVEFNTVFLGSSPFTTPALFSLMAHADLTQGVFYPKGGIAKLPLALYALASELGVEFLFGTEARRIVVNNGKAEGIETKEGYIKADIVVSTADYHFTDTVLLSSGESNYSSGYWNRRTLAPSTFLIYLGINKKLPGLIHHSFYLARDWKKHFSDIFSTPRWPDNPCYYMGCPSKTDPSVAPPGGETLFVLVPIAPGLDDSDEHRAVFTDMIINDIEKLLGESFQAEIAVKKIASQRDFMRDYHLFQGTALGLAHTLFQSAIFRPRHKSKKVKNLYYGGHYTQPGIGMPMALIGGRMIAAAVAKNSPAA